MKEEMLKPKEKPALPSDSVIAGFIISKGLRRDDETHYAIKEALKEFGGLK